MKIAEFKFGRRSVFIPCAEDALRKLGCLHHLKDDVRKYYQRKLASITVTWDFKHVVFTEWLYVNLSADELFMFFAKAENFRLKRTQASSPYPPRVAKLREMMEYGCVDPFVIQQKYELLVRNQLADDVGGITYNPQGIQRIFNMYEQRTNRAVRAAFMNLATNYFYLRMYAGPIIMVLVDQVTRPLEVDCLLAIDTFMYKDFRSVFMPAFREFAKGVNFAADVARREQHAL